MQIAHCWPPKVRQIGKYMHFISRRILIHWRSHPSDGALSQSIIRRFVENNFEPRYCTTIGADYMRKDITTPSGDRVRMQLWDIAGMDKAHTARHFLKIHFGSGLKI